MVNGLFTLKEGEAELEFLEKLNEWILENGWEFRDAAPIEIPDNSFRPVHAIGSAVFHPEYNGNDSMPEVNRRYFLRRTWNANLPILTTFMMNPSSASELTGDNTVDFMMDYAKRHGYGTLLVVNTSPVIKRSNTNETDFPPDANNWFYIKYALSNATEVVLGWGEKGQKYGVPILKSNYALAALLERHHDKLRVFGYGKENTTGLFPKHPHPQKMTQRFPLDHVLQEVTVEKRILMLR
ncbi:MAG: DUF1643 domain-containing protein [Desulfosporosinus sp.]|nr:DUF1643 domain-containing protein [Desulfosporosinus sp.]